MRLNKQQKKERNQTMIIGALTKLTYIGVLVLLLAGTAAGALEFSGEAVQLTGAQTTDIIWDKDNFGGFCYDINGSIGTETLVIAAGTLTGHDIDQTIETNALMYTTSSIWREYELHKNLGLTVESDHYGGDSGYWIEFWMGERYVAVDGKSNKLAKPLVEFNSTDTKTLVTGEPWDLGGGFVLTAQQIDLEGEKVWLSLCKDGKELDSEVIDTGGADLQERVYTYAEDVAGEDEIPIFSCYVYGIVRGTDSNCIHVKYVFLIDNDILQISTGEYYGNMEVVSTTPYQIALENWKSIYLYYGTRQIMGDLSFKVVSNTSAIEFYPHLIRDELPVLSGGGGFVSDSYWCPWNLSENYVIALQQVDLEGNKAMIALFKDDVVVDERILTEEFRAPVDSDCRYKYVKDGTEIVTATMTTVFHGNDSNMAELAEVYQRSEVDGSILINNETHLFKSANPTGISWYLADDYVLTMKDIGLSGDETWLELSKNGVVVKEKILNEDFANTFAYTSGIGSINCVVDRVFRGCEANVVKLVNVDQYSDVNGTALLVDGSHFYKSADPDGMTWELMDGYVFTMKDIDLKGNKVWLELSKDGNVLKEDILEPDDMFEYSNGLESVDCIVEAVFRGTLADVVKLRNVNQYSNTGTQLIGDGSKTYATADPPGGIWDLLEDYSLAPKDIDLEGEKVWLSLLKNDVVVKDAIIDPRKDGWFTYYNATGALIFSAYVDAIFRGTDTNIIQLKYVSQYSEIDGSVLIMFDETDKKTLSVPSRFPETLTVDGSGGADFTSIRAAVNAAIHGDTICVHAGEYVESVDVSKRLTLIGEGADVVMVQAEDASNHVFRVTADYVSISGFTVAGAIYGYGIYLSGADHCNISNNDVSNNSGNIYLDSSSNNILMSNTINSAGGFAVYLDSSSNNTLRNNIVESDFLGIIVIGYTKEGYDNSIDTSNILNGKSIYYYYDLHGTTIQGLDTVHLTVACSDNVTIRNNNVGDGDIMFLPFLNDSTIMDNTVQDNYLGIYLWAFSCNNTLYHNNLINNTGGNACDEGGGNQWDDGSEGNYYSDYKGNDTDGDGIGEDPYLIHGGASSVDRYPLMQPWGTSQKGDLNGDNTLTPADAAIALQIAASGGWDPTADVSDDGSVTSIDALMILQAAADNIEL